VIDLKKTGVTVLSIFSLFLVWVVAFVVVSSPMLLPSPWKVFEAFFNLFVSPDSLQAMLSSFLRLLLALAIAFVLGFVLGVWAGFKANVATFLRPFVSVLRTIPVISIVVILLILFGFKYTPYIITFLMIFPIIFQSVYDGILHVDSELVDVYMLEDNRLITGLRYCYIPLIQSSIKTALLQSAGLGIKVLVMAEYLSQTKHSIGNALYLSKVNLAYDEVFAWTLLLIFLAVIFEILIEKYTDFKTKTSAFPSKPKSISKE